jgi:hypothetical protein
METKVRIADLEEGYCEAVAAWTDQAEQVLKARKYHRRAKKRSARVAADALMMLDHHNDYLAELREKIEDSFARIIEARLITTTTEEG